MDDAQIRGLTIEEVVAEVEKTGNLVAKYWRPKHGGRDRLYANYPNGRKDAGFVEILPDGTLVPHLTGVEGERAEKRLRAAAATKALASTASPAVDAQPSVDPAAQRRSSPHGPNRREGVCTECRAVVAPGAGVLDAEFDDDAERWTYSVRCADAQACDRRRDVYQSVVVQRREEQQKLLALAQEGADRVRAIFDGAEAPTGQMRRLVGEVLEFSPPLHGRGTWAVIEPEGAEGRAVWWVINNGADGDDWRLNNVETGGAGAIGRRVPWTPEVEADVRASHAARTELIALDSRGRR